MQKDFILGVGCQKGATSWLRSNLNRHETCNFGFKKEYHVFDVLYNIDNKFKKKKNLIFYLGNKLKKGIENNSLKNEYLHVLFLLDVKNYFNYFNSLFLKNKNLTTTGDITPAYSGLPVEAYKDIKENLEKRDFKVKVIFIMRDPVERIWSHARMRIKNYNSNRLDNTKFADIMPIINNLDSKNLENELVQLLYKDIRFINRTNYKNTINNLEKIFNKDDIFYSLYENLFEKETLDRLKDFLGLKNLNFKGQEIINRTPKSNKVELSDDLKKHIFNFYKDTYSLCDLRFNAKSSWNYY